MGITYDAPSNTLTVTDGTYDFEDIYNADVAGGWGVVSKQGQQYLIDASFTVGDESEGNAATVQDEGKQVQIGSESNHIMFKVTEYSTLQMGNNYYSSITWQPEYGWRGNSLVIWQDRTSGYSTSYGDLILYSCYLENAVNNSIHIRWRGNIQFEDVTMHGLGNVFFQCDGTMKRVNITVRQSYGFMCYTDGLTLEDVVCDNAIQGLVCGYGGTTVVVRNCSIRCFVPSYNPDRQVVNNRLKVYIERDYDNPDTGSGTDVNNYFFHTPQTITITKPGYWPYKYELDLTRDDHKTGVNHTVSLRRISVQTDQEAL